jgi:hypothetical protein
MQKKKIENNIKKNYTYKNISLNFIFYVYNFMLYARLYILNFYFIDIKTFFTVKTNRNLHDTRKKNYTL